VITVGNTGPSDELELALTDALVADPTCELRGLPPPFG
jgi:hypothetical protein